MPRDHFAYGLVQATVGIAGRHDDAGAPPSEAGLPASEPPEEAPPLSADEVPPLDVDDAPPVAWAPPLDVDVEVVPPLVLAPPLDVDDVPPLALAVPAASQLAAASQLGFAFAPPLFDEQPTIETMDASPSATCEVRMGPARNR